MGYGGVRESAAGLVFRPLQLVTSDGSGTGPGDGFTVAAIDASGLGDQRRSDEDQRQVDAMRRARAAGERALVLGGGGSARNAWEIGVVAGLFEAGLDVTEADLIIGTSAGSTVAAQITSAAQPGELLAEILAAEELPPPTGPVGSGVGRAPRMPAVNIMETTSEIIGAAVAASCANGFTVSPYSIGGNRYVDGGYRRSTENADLAAGYERVLVLSPFGGRSRHPLHWGMQLAVQVDELRARGSRVETIFPDTNSQNMFGVNAMDLSTRPPAARAGYNQGRTLAEKLTGCWR